MISGKVTNTTTAQVIVANHNGENFFYFRNTNGGRGEANSWSKKTDTTSFANFTYPIIGEVLATPLTSVDTQAIESNELPNVLIQKLTKQYRLRPIVEDTERTFNLVLDEVLNDLAIDPTLLAKYRSDNRGNTKTTTPKGNVVPTIKPQTITQAVIKVVHDNYKDNALSFVPSLSNPELSNYVERTFANGRTETQIYDYALRNREVVSLIGDAGTGKTTSAMRYAGLRGLRFYKVSFNAGVESSQLFGKLLPTQEGKLAWQDGGFTECWRNGNAVILLDELSFIVAKQSGVLMPTMDNTKTLTLLDNKGEVIPMGDNVLLVCAYNENYRGNNKLNQAFADRFNHKLLFEYDTEIEKKFIPSSTLLSLASQMRADSIAGVYETPISTRLLKNFVKYAKDLGYEYAVDNFLANFSVDERASVKLLLEAHRHNLEAELLDVA